MAQSSMTGHRMAHPCVAWDGTARDGTGALGPQARWGRLHPGGCPGATHCLSPGGGGAAAGGPGAAPLLGAGGGHPNSAWCHLEDADGAATLQRAEPRRTR